MRVGLQYGQLGVSTSQQSMDWFKALKLNVVELYIKRMATVMATKLAVFNSRSYPSPCLKPGASRRFW